MQGGIWPIFGYFKQILSAIFKPINKSLFSTLNGNQWQMEEGYSTEHTSATTPVIYTSFVLNKKALFADVSYFFLA